MFDGKVVLLGVSGGIAAFKAAQLASDLSKTAAETHVLMTKNATEFVTPMTFETLVNNRVAIDTFDRSFEYNVEHVALARRASVVIIAPATANVIAKLAAGIADDMLTTTVLACSCPKIVAPAMNTGMYDNPVTQRNLDRLRRDGWTIVEPEEGLLACGDVGRGKLADIPTLFEAVRRALTEQDMRGLRVLVTAGPTQEAVDPVRFLTNHSTGRMGYELAAAAARRGADVTLVSGRVALVPPCGVSTVPIVSAGEMFDEVTGRAPEMDIIIKCAAVADYRPVTVAGDKIKKSGDSLTLELERTQDILAWLGEHRPDSQVLCGFSMETRDLIENSRAKLERKKADMIVANSLTDEGAGFATATNKVTLITREGTENLPLMGKDEVSMRILDRLLAMRRQRADPHAAIHIRQQ